VQLQLAERNNKMIKMDHLKMPTTTIKLIVAAVNS